MEDRLDIDYYSIKIEGTQDFKRLGDLVNIKGGKRIPLGFNFTEEYTGYKYLRVDDIKDNGNFSYNELKNISEDVYRQIENYFVSKNDIIISIAGTVGKVSEIEEDFHNKLILTENCAKLSVLDNKLLNHKYLKYILENKTTQKQFKKNLIKTTIEKLGLDRLRNILIPLPPLEIQEQIVQKMNDALTQKKQMEQEAENLLNGIDDFVLSELGIDYKEIPEEKLYGVNFEDIKNSRIDPYYNNPKFKKLESMLENGKYGAEKIMSNLVIDCEYINQGDYEYINYVDLSCVNEKNGKIENYNVIEKKDFPSRARQKVSKRDLLVSGLSGSMKSIAVVEDELKNMVASTGFIVVNKNNKYNTNYLSGLFRTNLFQDIMKSKTSGAIMSAISIYEFSKIKIPVPPIETQNQIASEVKSRIDKAQALKIKATQSYESAKNEVEEMILGE